MGWLSLNQSVGTDKGQNKSKDIKIAQALLNVYLRREKKATLKLTTKINKETNQAIIDFQSKELNRSKPDGRIDPGGGTYKALIKVLKASHTTAAIVDPTYGVVTWNSEGAEGGMYHSRKLHVPGSTSGLTLGRGYDFRRKKQATIIANLTTAGVDAKIITVLKNAAGLYGNTAEQFIIDNDLLDFQIQPNAQKKLFKISYDYEASQVKRISTKKDVVKLYGACDWDKLHSGIKDIAIDLKFRGDYTSKSRKFLQQSIADNDLEAFKKEIINKNNWPGVPADRFKRRKDYIEKQKAKAATATSPK